MKFGHLFFYFLEFLVIGSGFGLILYLDLSFTQQAFVLMGNLMVYIVVGILHHSIHNNINLKVVLEYILLSVLIFTLFVFLNISKL